MSEGVRDDPQVWHCLELLRMSFDVDDEEGFDSALNALADHRAAKRGDADPAAPPVT